MCPTIGQQMTRADKRAMDEAVIAANYDQRQFYAPMAYKADDEDDGESFLKPIKFEGFANVAAPDFGNDIVEPSAFSNQTLREFLKHGRQLFWMHDSFTQVGEINHAERVQKGTRSLFGIKDGGLLVRGFVDSPVDPESGFIPDHPLARAIHFVRMQVAKGRLKALSIGWRPMKSEIKELPDPRRNGEKSKFRIVKSLQLREVSIVTMPMSPESTFEIRKSFADMYGDEVAEALFCDATSVEERGLSVPADLNGLNEDRCKEIIVGAYARAKLNEGKPLANDLETDQGPNPKLKLVSLDDGAPCGSTKYEVVHLD